MRKKSSRHNAHNLQLVSPNNKILNQIAHTIPPETITQKAIQDLISAMLSVANGTQGNVKQRTMVGLAAPQLGISKRVIIIDIAATGMGETPDLRVYINPTITKKSHATEQGREGCFSTGNVCGIVERLNEITVEAYNHQGKQVSETWAGFTARIFQHEIDHLNGIRFPDLIDDDTKLHWVEPDKFGEYRTEWAQWQELCPRDKWELIKTNASSLVN